MHVISPNNIRYGLILINDINPHKSRIMNNMNVIKISLPMDPSTFLESVWGISYYNLEA
jgi:hypothetical protein